MRFSRMLPIPLCMPMLALPACRTREAAAPPNPEFAVEPPLVESSSVRLLERTREDANAVLTVRFAADPRLGRTVAITPDSTRVVVLRDDGQEPDTTAGDRTFAGFLRVDPEELSAFRRHLAAGAARFSTVPEFRGREIVGQTSTQELLGLDTTRVTPGTTIDLRALGFLFVNADRSLMVRDPAVLADPQRTFDPCDGGRGNPNGKWTFNYLMTQMANQPVTGVTPARFVSQWLNQWVAPQSVNGLTIPARSEIRRRIIDTWPRLPGGDLDLSRAPFRLVAIVNRVDLRTNSLYGGGNAGEGRFVFEAVIPAICQPLPFTVILEYGVPKRFCPEVRAYAGEWLALGALTPGTPEYATRLEEITEQFAAAGANPSRPNRSALNQLRTNEIMLSMPWEMREFKISGRTNLLAAAAVKQTPHFTSNNSRKLAEFINANAAGILANRYTVPAQFQGEPFLGAASPVPSRGTFWDGSGQHPSAQVTTADTRFNFSLGTCSGCHAGETRTGFQHVNSGGLSGFLTGITVADPAGETAGGEPTRRMFNDLQRRAQDLDALVNSPCPSELAIVPLLMSH